MKDPVKIVAALYRYPRMFDDKQLLSSLKKILQHFFIDNVGRGLSIFSNVDRDLFEAVIDSLKPKNLHDALQAEAKGGTTPKSTAKANRARILTIVYGDPSPPPDKAELTKKHVLKLKTAKSTEDLQSIYKEIGSEEGVADAFELMTLAGLTTVVRRFDKENASMVGARKSVIIGHLMDLGSGRAHPIPKPVKKLRTAAAKAKWSGKEPD